jgi:hypothetical protein
MASILQQTLARLKSYVSTLADSLLATRRTLYSRLSLAATSIQR